MVKVLELVAEHTTLWKSFKSHAFSGFQMSLRKCLSKLLKHFGKCFKFFNTEDKVLEVVAGHTDTDVKVFKIVEGVRNRHPHDG